MQNYNEIQKEKWGAILKGKDNLIVLKEVFYVLISYPSFLRNLRQTLRLGKEHEEYFVHIQNIAKLLNSSNRTGTESPTILASLQRYLENAYLSPVGELIVNDLLDCIYTDKSVTFEKYRYTIKTTVELFEEVSVMDIPEKYYYKKPILNSRGNNSILSLEDELAVLFKKLGLKGMVTLCEVLTSLVYIKS